jgi:sugar transferase (PEP-CTERM/EpsH1 system associated)
MLAHRIPYPPHTGDKTRAFHIARYLAQRHELTLAFLVDDQNDLTGVNELRQSVPDILFARLWKPASLVRGVAGLVRGATVTLPYFYSRALVRQAARRHREAGFDMVYASSTAMAQYSPTADVPLVMDFVDVDSDKWRQYAERRRAPLGWLYRTEARRLQGCEGEIARRATLSLLATDVEAELLRSFAPWARTAVVPNGIDSVYYAPQPVDPTEPAVIFTGAMDYLPNIDAVQHFCTDIFPLVRREVPGTVFYIVGLNPSADVRRLGEIPGVVVTGPVPDVRPYYARARVCVAPLRIGRGIQNKVLQGMAMGLPVVATPLAARGVLGTPGVHLEVADGVTSFAAQVVRLLGQSAARRDLGLAGRACVETHYTWERNLAGLESLLVQAAVRSARVGHVAGVPVNEARARSSRA